jgi:hypothetical protein
VNKKYILIISLFIQEKNDKLLFYCAKRPITVISSTEIRHNILLGIYRLTPRVDVNMMTFFYEIS